MGARLHRYQLWMDLCDHDCNPEDLTRRQLLAFIDDGLSGYLAGQRATLNDKVLRKLRREMERYDPHHPTPYEFMERLAS
jgi:hypothetical protein